MISSIYLRKGKLYIDATNNEISVLHRKNSAMNLSVIGTLCMILRKPKLFLK